MAKLITASEVISIAFTNANTDRYIIKDSFIEIAQYNHLRPVIGEDLYNKIISIKNSGVAYKFVKSCSINTGSATVTSSAQFGSIQKNFYAEGTGIPLFKDGYKDNEDNHYTKVSTVTDSSTITLNATATALGSIITLYSPEGYLIEKLIKNLLAFAVKFEALPDMTYNSTSQGIVENIADFTTPVNSKKLSFLRNEIYKQAQTYKRLLVEFIQQEDNNYPLYIPDDDKTTKRSGIIMY